MDFVGEKEWLIHFRSSVSGLHGGRLVVYFQLLRQLGLIALLVQHSGYLLK